MLRTATKNASSVETGCGSPFIGKAEMIALWAICVSTYLTDINHHCDFRIALTPSNKCWHINLVGSCNPLPLILSRIIFANVSGSSLHLFSVSCNAHLKRYFDPRVGRIRGLLCKGRSLWQMPSGPMRTFLLSIILFNCYQKPTWEALDICL